MSGKTSTRNTPGYKSQASRLATLSVGEALASSRANLRTVERLLFTSDPRSAAGLLLSQFELLLTRLEVGVPVEQDGVLGLLCAASKVGRGVRAP
jgi:hypothetical protein